LIAVQRKRFQRLPLPVKQANGYAPRKVPAKPARRRAAIFEKTRLEDNPSSRKRKIPNERF
jgi:hypothetical protein